MSIKSLKALKEKRAVGNSMSEDVRPSESFDKDFEDD